MSARKKQLSVRYWKNIGLFAAGVVMAIAGLELFFYQSHPISGRGDQAVYPYGVAGVIVGLMGLVCIAIGANMLFSAPELAIKHLCKEPSSS